MSCGLTPLGVLCSEEASQRNILVEVLNLRLKFFHARRGVWKECGGNAVNYNLLPHLEGGHNHGLSIHGPNGLLNSVTVLDKETPRAAFPDQKDTVQLHDTGDANDHEVVADTCGIQDDVDGIPEMDLAVLDIELVAFRLHDQSSHCFGRVENDWFPLGFEVLRWGDELRF